MLAKIRRWFLLWFGGLLVLLVLLLWFSPEERTLGQSVKLVYLHGALVRTAVVLFAVSLPVNLGALVTGKKFWLAWGKALAWTAISIWLVHTLVSLVTTYATWGVFIAWQEPRTRFTFNLAAVALMVLAMVYLVANPQFAAGVFAVLAGVVLMLIPGLGFIQHPFDPIGTSPSNTIRIFYAAMLVVLLALAGLVTVRLHGRISGPTFR